MSGHPDRDHSHKSTSLGNRLLFQLSFCHRLNRGSACGSTSDATDSSASESRRCRFRPRVGAVHVRTYARGGCNPGTQIHCCAGWGIALHSVWEYHALGVQESRNRAMRREFIPGQRVLPGRSAYGLSPGSSRPADSRDPRRLDEDALSVNLGPVAAADVPVL
jgi:hypothetical protein